MAFAAHIPARAQARATPVSADSNTQATTSSQGYLGIDIADVDAEKTQALRLKDTRGAVITLIDHDAPAGQVGLKVNDVVIQFNGQAVENADQFRRMLKEIPPGRKVTLEFSRDGSIQTLTLELADRKLMEKNVWSKLGTSSKGGPQPQMGFLGGNTEPSGFHMPSFGSSLKVGALVEPLTAQMAAHLGVDSGLMVKEVTHKSDAEVAGFRAFDVILKVGADSIATAADWDRALRANQGKPVQVIILRDNKQETLTLQVDSKHRQDKSGIQNPLTPEQQEELVQLESNLSRLNSEIAQQLADQIDSEANARATQAQTEAEAMRDRMQGMHFGLSPEAAEQLRQQTEKLRESLKAFQADHKQLKDLQRQMEEFRKNFHPDQFKIDPKEMQEFQHRMDDFRHQMEQWSAGNDGHFV
jgi:membrane-associated protease RseP (regulator of RpoE activity)